MAEVFDLDRIIDTYSENKTESSSAQVKKVESQPHDHSFDLGNQEIKKIEASVEEKTPSIAPDEELQKDLATIPDKLAFKIGEVAELIGVKQYVLRYWETEFEALKPKKSRQNQRMYSKKDVETVCLIKKLLYRDRFSIEGAKKALRTLKSEIKEDRQWSAVADRFETASEQIESLIEGIRGIKNLFR